LWGPTHAEEISSGDAMWGLIEANWCADNPANRWTTGGKRMIDLDKLSDLEKAAMLETVNADTIFAGVIQTWKTENQTLKSQIADLEKRNADLEARVAALKEIAVEGWAVAEFGGEQEGQDYHLYFREWNIDRESYRKEALELLQAEHPEVFR